MMKGGDGIELNEPVDKNEMEGECEKKNNKRNYFACFSNNDVFGSCICMGSSILI